MRITESRLRQIIREEVKRSIMKESSTRMVSASRLLDAAKQAGRRNLEVDLERYIKYHPGETGDGGMLWLADKPDGGVVIMTNDPKLGYVNNLNNYNDPKDVEVLKNAW